jgi:hypothetical protein
MDDDDDDAKAKTLLDLVLPLKVTDGRTLLSDDLIAAVA